MHVSQPVTLASLIRQHKLLWCYCRDCGRERDLDPSSLPLPGEFPVPQVGNRMKCTQCGSRKIATAPELYPGGIEAMRQKRRERG